MQWRGRWRWGEEEGGVAFVGARHAVPLLFRGREIGVRARAVIGDVHDPLHLGDVAVQHGLDALAQRHIGHATALAAAAHPQHHHGVLHVDQLDAPTVARHHRVYLVLEQPGDAVVQRVVVQAAADTLLLLIGAPSPFKGKLGALTATVVRQLVQFETSLNEDVANRVGASALDILATTLEAELSEDAEGEGRHHARLTRVKRYVAANLHDAEMTIESIAAAQNLAPRTLHRLFSAEGTTPIRWLWQQRLSASYKALAEGHIRHVTDAALSFGFSDLSHFSRAFKKTFGHAPHILVRR